MVTNSELFVAAAFFGARLAFCNLVHTQSAKNAHKKSSIINTQKKQKQFTQKIHKCKKYTQKMQKNTYKN
jgi:hypothetical protein